MYPAPVNCFAAVLLPFVYNKERMKVMARHFSVFMFWLENSIYICLFFLYSAAHIPWVYLKTSFNLLKMGSILHAMMIIPLWVLLGLFYLLYALVKDMISFCKILTFNFELNESMKKQEGDDLIEDKVIIYNEVVDVMKAINFLYKDYKLKQQRRRTRKEALKRTEK